MGYQIDLEELIDMVIKEKSVGTQMSLDFENKDCIVNIDGQLDMFGEI